MYIMYEIELKFYELALNTKEKNVLRMLLILTYRDRGSNKASKKRQINKNQLINRFCFSWEVRNKYFGDCDPYNSGYEVSPNYKAYKIIKYGILSAIVM